MAARPSDKHLPWWHRRAWSLAVFIGVLTLVVMAVAVITRDVVEVLPEVPKDELGDDNWVDQLGVELGGGLQVAQLPECAADPITRIALWDADSNPYWEVAGPATPFTSFVIGVAPTGFDEVTPYRRPADDDLVRLIVFRRVGGAAGIRYRAADLVDGRVISGTPMRTYTRDGFRKEKVCGDTAGPVAGDPADPFDTDSIETDSIDIGG